MNLMKVDREVDFPAFVYDQGQIPDRLLQIPPVFISPVLQRFVPESEVHKGLAWMVGHIILHASLRLRMS